MHIIHSDTFVTENSEAVIRILKFSAICIKRSIDDRIFLVRFKNDLLTILENRCVSLFFLFIFFFKFLLIFLFFKSRYQLNCLLFFHWYVYNIDQPRFEFHIILINLFFVYLFFVSYNKGFMVFFPEKRRKVFNFWEALRKFEKMLWFWIIKLHFPKAWIFWFIILCSNNVQYFIILIVVNRSFHSSAFKEFF